MNNLTKNPAPARRIGILFLCLLAAFGAAIFFKPTPSINEKSQVKNIAPLASTSDQILGAILVPTGTSETFDALKVDIVKARENKAQFSVWVDLGDTLAQVFRETENFAYYNHAEAAYLHALQLNPQSVDAMAGMAWVNGGRHDFAKSMEWANKALTIDPENAAAYGISGDAALELGDYEGALEHYQKMMDLKPDLSSWSRGAWLLWVTGDTSKAVWLMDKAIKAGAPYAENTAWCRARLATMHFRNGAYLPAAQVLKPALDGSSKNIHVLLAAARIATAQKDYPTAQKHYETLLTSVQNHDALVELGDLLAVQGQLDEAEKYYIQVEALYKNHQVTGNHGHMEMAKFYADHDRNLIEALRIAEQSKLTKNVFQADILAWVYFKNGDFAKAGDTIKRALAQNTRDAQIHYHAGMIAAMTGDRVTAQKHFQEALSINPNFNPLQSPILVSTLEKLGSVAVSNSPVPK